MPAKPEEPPFQLCYLLICPKYFSHSANLSSRESPAALSPTGPTRDPHEFVSKGNCASNGGIRSISWLAGRLVGGCWLANWLVGRLAGWLVLVGWLACSFLQAYMRVGWLAGWLVYCLGRLTGCSAVCWPFVCQ